MRGVLALSRAALLLTLAAGAARAQAPDAGRPALAAASFSDLPSWWSAYGSAGWTPLSWLGATWPWVVAGHVAGGWTLEEPGRPPSRLPGPGVTGMQTPIVWYDSVSVVAGAGAAWRGYDAGLVVATGYGEHAMRPGAAAVVDLRNGDFGYDENALTLERGDTTRWMRFEAVSGSRRAADGLDLMGRHLWGAAGGLQRRRHRLDASFAQRAASATLTGEDEQAVVGEGGAVRYRYRRDGFDVDCVAERSHDRHRSLGILLPSVREAGETVLRSEATLARDRSTLSFRAEWRDAHVSRRGIDGYSDPNPFDRRSHNLWGAARLDRTIGEGSVRLELGAGRHGALDRFDLAPSISYRFRAAGLAARVGAERVLAPVWTDLARGVEPFLQRTWAGVLEVDAGTRPRQGRVTFLFGRTQDRAIVQRLPLEEQWLRLGSFPESSSYDFALLSVDGQWEALPFAFGGNGFALARNESGDEARVDPAAGFRGWAAWQFRAFDGDLGVLLRGELEGVGARESPGDPTGLCGDASLFERRPLPGYVTLGGTAVVSIATAFLTFHIRDLENRRREEPWIDCATLSEGLGPGREYRFALTVRLTN